MRKTAAFIFLFITSFLSNFIFGQIVPELRLHAGFLAPHNPTMVNMFQHTFSLELNVGSKPPGNEISEKLLRNPYWGGGLKIMNYRTPLAGYAISPFVYFDFGVSRASKRQLRGRFATGAGYITQPFDLQNNRQNRAIGSHVNGFMQLNLYFQKQIKQSAVHFGLTFSHHSNGNWKQPNLGINVPSVCLAYRPGAFKISEKSAKPFPIPSLITNRLEWHLSARIGRKQVSIDDPRIFYPIILDASLNYPKSITSNIRLGSKIYLDKSYVFRNFEPMPTNPNPGRFTEISIFVGHEYRVGRIGFSTDLGFYVYRPDDRKRMYYEALGLKYYVSKHLVIFQGLKAHLTSADFLEFGLQYNIFSKRKVKPGIGNSFRWIFSGYKMEK